MRMFVICVAALCLLAVSANETQAREGLFARLVRSSGGSSGQAVAPVASYGSSGSAVAPVASYGSSGAATSGGSSGSATTYQIRLRPRLVPVAVPMTSTVYESAACPLCK